MHDAPSTAKPFHQRLPVAFFHKQCHLETGGKKLTYPKNSAAVLPFMSIDKKDMEKLVEEKAVSLYTIDSFFTRYQYPFRATSLFTHVGGGIGDMLAFSVIPAWLKNYMIRVYADEKFTPVFNWFFYPVDLRPYFRPIVTDFTGENRLIRYKYLRRLFMEYAAIEAGNFNWYDAMFQRIGMDEAPVEFRRPILKQQRQSDSKPLLSKNSVLIAHRSSCQMRSSRLEDFYTPVREAWPGRPIYIHETDLTDDDRRLIKGKTVHILPSCSIEQYLLNLYDAGMVVCTDSAAVHFREGVKKPCLVAMAAMTVESRTKYYRYTRSFDALSDCPHQPCFTHETRKGMVCENANEGDRTARCQIGIGFQEQLYNNLKAY